MKKFLISLSIIFLCSIIATIQESVMANTPTTKTQFSQEDLTKEYNSIANELSKLSSLDTDDALVLLDKLLPRIVNFKENIGESTLTNKQQFIDEANKALADLYYTKGLIYITVKYNLKIAEQSFIVAAKYNQKYSFEYFQNANEYIGNKQYDKAEMFLTCFIETYTKSKYTLANAYNLRAKIRHNYLKNKLGAIEDRKKAEELIK